MKCPILTATALLSLASGNVLALPQPVACWKADGQTQPEAGTEARTTKATEIGFKQGVAGKAFAFNGKTSVIEAAFEWKSASPAMTWSVWIRPTESTQQMEILTNDPFVNALYIRNGRIAIHNSGRNLEFGPVKWGVWQHVAVVFGADHVTVYDRSGPSRQAFPLRGASTQKRLLIGASTLGMATNFSGLIDQVAIYDRELTPAEITELSIRPKESGRDDANTPNANTPDKSPASPAPEWTNTEGKTITAEFVRLDGDAVVVKNGGKEFRIPFTKLSDASIRRAKALAAPEQAATPPAPVPSAPTTLQIKVASKVAKVDRWGTGDKALVLFSHTGPMNESVIGNISTYAPFFAAGYSIFLWTYPNSKPFTDTQKTLQSWMRGEDSRLDFSGVTTDLVGGIRAQTGIREFLVVGDSLGAGILLADYAKLSKDGAVRFVLISPTEPFSPEAKDLPVLKNSLLLANSGGDDFVRSAAFAKWIEGQRATETTTGPFPPGHLILGENLTHATVVNAIADFAGVPHGPALQPNSQAVPTQSLPALSDVAITFARIPAGTFQMGDSFGERSDIDGPVHTVQVSAYQIAVNKTTKSQWDAVRAWGTSHGYTDLSVGGGKAPNHPVHTVTWYDMVKWCNACSERDGRKPCYSVAGAVYRTGQNDGVTCDWSANGYRLPTEAEWEKAARGGMAGKRFPWGDTISHQEANFTNGGKELYQTGSLGSQPKFASGGDPFTSPVGSFAPNGFGLYDMAGNLWDWCWDRRGPYSGLAQTDPLGSDSGPSRIHRGGGWFSPALNCRVAGRYDTPPGTGNSRIGFRVAHRADP